MINWPICPMVYNDSFTYMEWLGKLTYIAENHEDRINDCEKNIVDIWEKINDYETRIGSLEQWRDNVVDPFISDITVRVETLEGDVSGLKSRMDTAEQNISGLRADLTAESSARRNADDALDTKINNVNNTAIEALNKVNKVNINLENIGTIRYFMDTATLTTSSGNTSLAVEFPDNDWVTCDIRFLADGKEYRITGTIEDTNLSVEVNGITFTFAYNDTTKIATVTAVSTSWSSTDIKRFDYLLYKGALTEAAQEQADIDFYNTMDANGDGYVDARDASLCLSYFSDVSAGLVPSGLGGKESWIYWANMKNTAAGETIVNVNAYPDFNEDGKINAIDASLILNYYAWMATDAAAGLTGPEAMKKYRTDREAGLIE